MKQALDAFFSPKTIAVVGATGDASDPGRAVISNLTSTPFGGTTYVVNPDLSSLLGLTAYPALPDVPEPIDLAIISGTEASVGGYLQQCIDVRVGGVVLLSSEPGFHVASTLITKARQSGARILGPNSIGVLRPCLSLNATTSPVMAMAGSVALVSQSAGICTALLDWGVANGLGFSCVVSLGRMIDVSWAEVLERLGADSRTQSIVLCMQTVGDARAFLSSAREVSLDKPIVVIRGGETSAVFEAAMRRVGVVSVHELNEVFRVTDLLATQPSPQGARLAIITNSAGPAILASDAARQWGIEVPPFLANAVQNPADLSESATAEQYKAALSQAVNDSGIDGIVVVQTPQSIAERASIGDMLARFPRSPEKPILAAWMGGADVVNKAKLTNAGIPVFDFPEAAVRAFHYTWRYTYNLRGIYETPSMPAEDAASTTFIGELLNQVYASGRVVLTDSEAAAVADAYGLPVTSTPRNPNAPSFLIESHLDREFGPVLSFGFAAPYASVTRRAFALPPLNLTLATRFLEQSEAYSLVRERDLEPVLVRVSQMVLEQTALSQIRAEITLDESPTLRSFEAILRGLDEQSGPQAAIRPYPAHYVSSSTLKRGEKVRIRPIRPEDEPALVAFHKRLSDQSVYLRFFAPLTLETRISHERLARLCFIDYDRQMAVIAQPEHEDSIIGVGRLIKTPFSTRAELAALVCDAWQRRGLGRVLVDKLLEFARDEGLTNIVAYVLLENQGMRTLLEKAGFRFSDYQFGMQSGELQIKRNC